jgi:hypothetical protein
MKKGTQILSVTFTKDGRVKAEARLKTLTIDLALTRNQRNLFRHYRDHDFLDQIATEFGNASILSDDFFIKINDEIVYRK